MASSSHNTFEGSIDETFDQYLINILIKRSRIFLLIVVIKKKKGKEGKNKFISKEIVKEAMYVYGMIISAKIQHILKIYSDDDLE